MENQLEDNVLEYMCRMNDHGQRYTVGDVFDQLGIGEAEKAACKNRLIQKGCLYVTDVGDLELTEYGRIRGEACCYRQDSLYDFLQLIGLQPDEARVEAERIKGAVSKKTIERIGDFVNYGDIYERTIRNTDLKFWHDPGDSPLLFGFYETAYCYPRRLAMENFWYEENAVLNITDTSGTFVFKRSNMEKEWTLWYKNGEEQWKEVAFDGSHDRIPSSELEYSFVPGELVHEGRILVAFTDPGQFPEEKNCKELNVHIW